MLLHNNLHAIHKNMFWLTWRGNNSHCLHDRLLKVQSCQTIHNYITKLNKQWKSEKYNQIPAKDVRQGNLRHPRRASSANDWNLTLGCRRFPCLALLPVLDSIYLLFWMNFVADLLWLFRSFYLLYAALPSRVSQKEIFLLEFYFKFISILHRVNNSRIGNFLLKYISFAFLNYQLIYFLSFWWTDIWLSI